MNWSLFSIIITKIYGHTDLTNTQMLDLIGKETSITMI
jgi:hypothetical protein